MTFWLEAPLQLSNITDMLRNTFQATLPFLLRLDKDQTKDRWWWADCRGEGCIITVQIICGQIIFLRDKFAEKFRRGDHFQSKNLYCKICTFKQGYLTMKLIQRGLFRLCLKNLQYNFPKMRRGSKDVWNFSENSSVLEGVGFPKRG